MTSEKQQLLLIDLGMIIRQTPTIWNSPFYRKKDYLKNPEVISSNLQHSVGTLNVSVHDSIIKNG